MTKREYHRERLCVLLEKEMSAAYRCVDYLSVWETVGFRPVSNEVPGRKMLTRIDRRRIGEWFFGATDFLDIPRYVASLAMKYFDTVLTRRYYDPPSRRGTNPSQEELQLLAVTSFYLAIKLSWSNHGWNAERMCKLAGNAFLPDVLLQEERVVLDTLEWRMHPPQANDFFHTLVGISSNDSVSNSQKQQVEQQAYYMMELAVLDYYFVEKAIPPSYIAMAALSNAIVMTSSYEHYSEPFFSVVGAIHIVMDQTRYHMCCKRLWDLYNSSRQSATPKGNPRTSSPASVTQAWSSVSSP
ncbi:hypothetical protein FisN_12Lu260 [Fistulifera solaris]|uniref:Cyclin N-terminal domain-containing protein n=1 Tax=Fistulifera solaris TaxID=1519565 RepID=A0A1Z5JMF9_FISSO|nr:hypothetical protein FisN_12Lu260 [Fistulifera solaris]|eukprot:GAX15174.1 hypothetical protein FisN_12Lu260 [Fistulifera solaris]